MKFIEYYRVSTSQQEASGLGLEAQEASVKRYIQSIQGSQSVGRFVEIESGGNKDRISVNSNINLESLLRKRPELKKAVLLAIKEDAIILVKESSRLSRHPLLIDWLITCRVKFLATDSPNDSEMIIKIKTVLSEDELHKVSARTKAALQARRERGLPLGTPGNLTNEGRAKAAKTRTERALNSDLSKQVTKFILGERKNGGTLAQIASELNQLGYKTSRQKEFTTSTVQMYINRATI
jgi:DNA invertase Pin-like site-specific DNA recombinase